MSVKQILMESKLFTLGDVRFDATDVDPCDCILILQIKKRTVGVYFYNIKGGIVVSARASGYLMIIAI